MVDVSPKRDRIDVGAPLRELALARGVTLEYVDGRGVTRRADQDHVLSVLNAMGDMEEMQTSAHARSRLRERRQRQIRDVVEPVYVVDEGVESTVPIHLGRTPTTFDCRLEFESGGEVSWSEASDALVPFANDTEVRGLALPVLRVGYHELSITTGRRSVTAMIIVRPLRGARGRFANDWRAFSVQAPIFTLHSSRTWGAGDVADLDEFARIVARHHASVVSTLPLLASFGPEEFEASPYRPVSRRFWNDRWIALDRIDALPRSDAARELMEVTYGPSVRAGWVRDGDVDGVRAFRAKRHVLQTWAETNGDLSIDNVALQSFVVAHPDVNDYARFRAAGERFGTDWRRWPSTAQSGLLRWNDVDPSVVRYHLIAQWIIDTQVRALTTNLAQRGQSLELDIPIGVHPFGYDVWSNRDQYVTSMSIGAPPDALSVQGQNWGAPPPQPEQCRLDAHRQFRAALRFHMSAAGVVRIDHVMGLQRLFWIPDGASPEEGVYVAMPFEELLAIIAIEAQRMGVDVVGEDLGTVDDGVRESMVREGLRRTYVAQFAIRADPDELDNVPSGAVASFGTHDTATFAGWWSESDLDERERLGLLEDEASREARARRGVERDALARSVGVATKSAPDDVLQALHALLAESDAGLVMAQLDDLLGETLAVNLPGTSSERSNWSRRSRRTLEELVNSTELDAALAPLSARRGVGAPAQRRQGRARTVPVTLLSPTDLHLLSEGRHFRLHRHLGSHPMVVDGVAGCYFALWAPNAERVAVVGEFNRWNATRHPLAPRENSGVWEGFVPGAAPLHSYKYRLRSRLGGDEFDKSDPMGRYFELSPATATRVWHSEHEWSDEAWLQRRATLDARTQPMSIYEVHLASWRRVPEEDNRSLTYRELAPLLAAYAVEMGFTHVELMPVMEHPFYGSWGYQTTGYFAPTSRLGTPDDFKYLIDVLHQRGVGVILDWVPSHFPSDAFALALFDGTHLYEHADVRQRVHPDWQSWTFNFGRNEVRSFLISNACYWIEEFHADGLRLDAVASMLYLDYSRKPGEWVANRYGGNEDLEAVEFLRQCTTELTATFPDVVVVAEESTAWPAVTGTVAHGGLGFTHKWDLGWMHDTLNYFSRDPIHRRHHQGELTFRAVYAAQENYVLALSHDEVVHGKGALVAKMPGDDWRRRANLRLLYGYQFTIPGKKLLFMGDEFAQSAEWSHESSLDWHLLDDDRHRGVARWVRRLNDLYREQPGLHDDGPGATSFEWISVDDVDQSVLVWRRGHGDDEVVVLANFTPVPHDDYALFVPVAGDWTVLANSDDLDFGGSGYGNAATYVAENAGSGPGWPLMRATVPPLAIVVLGRGLR